ncbi:MAG: flagellar filament capping protein FliD [Clostridium sp.]|nr:flagellar filament capping protein FliD [Clostridium sp.]
MSSISGATGTTVNPYIVSYSTSDVMDDPLLAATKSGSTSSTSSSSGSSSSGTYSQSLTSQMSGIDVNSMVQEMMTSDYTQLNQLLSKKQETQWTQDRYRSVITNLNNFSDNYFNILSSNDLTSANKYSVNQATSNDRTGTITASATNLAKQGNYTIVCNSAAVQSKIAYTPSLSSSVSNSSTLSQLLTSANLSGSVAAKLNFTVNGQAVSYDLGANSNESVSQFMNDLTSKSGINGATFSYSELTGQTSITNKVSGTGNNINISSVDPTTQTILNTLFGTNLSGGSTSEVIGNTPGTSGNTRITAGQNGSFTITEPGSTSGTTKTEPSNNFTIDGVNYNVANGAANNTTGVINVSANVSAVVSKIQGFITDYNNLIDGVNDAVNEKRDYTYSPLTSAQESQMTSSQITAWNTKAQTGLLQNDDTLSDMLSSMRTAFYTPVSGNGLTMADIGLSTTDDYTKGGELKLDVPTLTKALQSNPEGVINLLTQTSTSVPSFSTTLTSTQIKTKYNEEGIFQRLHDIKQEYSNDITTDGILVDKAGNSSTDVSSAMYKQLKDETDAITQFKLRVTGDKTRYTTQFTQLQAAMSQLSSQQNYLSSMLSSSSGS